MDALLAKLERIDERLDDEVLQLKEEIARSKLQVVKLESELKEEIARNKLHIVKLETDLNSNKKKIKDLEREKSTPKMCHCRSTIDKVMKEANSLQLQVTSIDKEFQVVKGKCEELSKLQSLLNSFLLKGQKSALIESQVRNIKTRQDCLYVDVKDLKDALVLNQATNQQGPLTKISKDLKSTIQFDDQYHSSRSQNVSVDHGSGTFTYIRNSYGRGQIISAQPLCEEYSSYSLEIGECGRDCCIDIGVCPMNFPFDMIPGSVKGTVGYYLHHSRIYSKSTSIPTNAGRCKKGDVIKCDLNFSNNSIHFFKNGVEVRAVTERNFMPKDFHSLCACIVFWGDRGKVVKALETEPWRL